MHVLVCEDDPAARFVIKRWLSSTLGCNVTDCEDGVQALDLLSTHTFDLAVLDLDLPRLGGVEVVEAIRGSGEEVRDLPIVILSHERRQEVVRELVGLGISDYLLKPLRAQTVRDRIGPLLAMRRHGRASAAAVAHAHLGFDAPALLVDGDANFRHVFTSVASQFGTVVTADSGAEALASFRRTPVDLIFIGENLGIMGADVLVRKIQDGEMRRTVFVKVGEGDPLHTPDVFAATIPRPFVPDHLAKALAPFVHVPGPLSAFGEMAPRLQACLSSAVVQVFGMMSGLDAVETHDLPPTLAPGVRSLVTVAAGERFSVDLELIFALPVLRNLATQMLGMSEHELDDEAVNSTASELANMVSGRMDAWLKNQNLGSSCTLPATTALADTDPLPTIGAGDGFSLAFALQDLRPPMVLRCLVRRLN